MPNVAIKTQFVIGDDEVEYRTGTAGICCATAEDVVAKPILPKMMGRSDRFNKSVAVSLAAQETENGCVRKAAAAHTS